MKVYSAYQKGQLTVYLHGELDHHGVKSSMDAIERLLNQYLPRDVVLDLSGLNFMDSRERGRASSREFAPSI